jgi:transcriptional regulator with GAF, ATPase, and Fis domain
MNYLSCYGFAVIPMGSIGNIILVGLLAYAAMKHRLMDIDVFVMRAAATALAAVVAVLPVAAVLIWASGLPFAAASGLVAVSLLLVTFVSVFGFPRLRTHLEREIETSLFPARKAARDAIRQLSKDLVKLPHPGDVGERVATSLAAGLGLSGVAIYVTSKPHGHFRRTCATGEIDAPEEIARTVDAPQPVGDDTTALPTPSQWEACVPIPHDRSALGFIALGPKRSGAAIDDTDIALLSMVAAQLGIALQNADFVRQIERQKAKIEELKKQVEAENVSLRTEIRAASQFEGIIGCSAALQRVLGLVETAAPTNASILISGDTGTGKELIARAIHELSLRRSGPLVSINCPAVAPSLALSELFGHERGAFTDAIEARPGKFELANGGTIFLDEVADLSLDVQVKLLRVLQEREVQRIGGRKILKLDIRVLAATNRNLEEEMRLGRFREDLYYRLATFCIHVPSLRERSDDIAMLATFFLQRAAASYQKPVTGFTSEALAVLHRYSWPGNIRELQNVVERAVLLCTSTVIRPQQLVEIGLRAAAAAGANGNGGTGATAPVPVAAPAAPSTARRPTSLNETLRAEKRRRVEQALADAGGNRAVAARLLGMSSSNFARLLRRLGVVPAQAAP